jgi:hypothetical protein
VTILGIIGKEIDLARCRQLYGGPITPASFDRDWCTYNSEWHVEGEWLAGKNPGNWPGMAILRADFPGNVLIDFVARTVPPCTHDIDVMWNGSWDQTTNQRGIAYVAGIEGWWDRKVGLEKSPEYKLTAATPLLRFTPGQAYHIQAGSVDGHCFVFVDGQLALEMTDPDPIDAQRFAKVGFEAYCSHIMLRDIQVFGIAWEARARSYAPEF